MEKTKKTSLTVFCHFSFKRPKGENYGLFSVAFYRDFPGKSLITHLTRKYELWENQQFVTAIQSYEHALRTIYEYQGMMKNNNINQVILVTDNSTLAGWILNPKKNKQYYSYMERAAKPYRVGSYKEIVIGIGLSEPRKAEKSYKYCKEELVTNNDEYNDSKKETAENQSYAIEINPNEYKSIIDIVKEDKAIPTISGISEV